MGKRGPQPIPSMVKMSRGTWRADRAASNEPIATGKPTCPSWLSPDGKREYRRIVRLLSDMGVIGQIDANVLTRYAATWVRWRQAVQAIQTQGDIVPIISADGNETGRMQNPHTSIARQLSEQLDRLEGSLGMNPSARSRISVAMPPQKPAEQDKSRFFDAPGPLKFTGGTS